MRQSGATCQGCTKVSSSMAGVETDTASRMEKAVVNGEGGRFEIVHVFVLFQRGLK